jgi:hypothetical protein
VGRWWVAVRVGARRLPACCCVRRLHTCKARRPNLLYHRQHYSAERMTLVLLGGQPLDELESWVRAGCPPHPSPPSPPLARVLMQHMGAWKGLLKQKPSHSSSRNFHSQ